MVLARAPTGFAIAGTLLDMGAWIALLGSGAEGEPLCMCAGGAHLGLSVEWVPVAVYVEGVLLGQGWDLEGLPVGTGQV